MSWLTSNRAAYVVGAVWCAGVVVTMWSSSRGLGEGPGCMFRKITGYPCATCGATRAAGALLHGDVGRAIKLNPLMTGLIALTPLGILAWCLARAKGWVPTARFWRWATIALIVSVCANWAFVLMRGVV